MSRRSAKDGLWSQVDRLLERRPGWSFQAMTTPGAPSAWCFGPERRPELLVTVDKGSIHVFETASEHGVTMSTTDELTVWLTERFPGSLQPQRGGVADRVKRRRFFEW